MSEREINVDLELLAAENIPEDRVDLITRQLTKELSGPDFRANLQRGATPAGAKGPGALLGAIAVKLAPELLGELIKRVKLFLSRGENRRIRVKVQLKGRAVEVDYPTDASPSDSEIERLVSALKGTLGEQRGAKS